MTITEPRTTLDKPRTSEARNPVLSLIGDGVVLSGVIDLSTLSEVPPTPNNL